MPEVNVYFNGSLTEPIRIPCPLVEVSVNSYGHPIGKIQSPFGHGGTLHVQYTKGLWTCDVD